MLEFEMFEVAAGEIDLLAAQAFALDPRTGAVKHRHMAPLREVEIQAIPDARLNWQAVKRLFAKEEPEKVQPVKIQSLTARLSKSHALKWQDVKVQPVQLACLNVTAEKLLPVNTVAVI